MGGEGFEPASKTTGEMQVHESGGSKSGNNGGDGHSAGTPDPDLGTVVAEWARLPAGIRAAILLIVKSPLGGTFPKGAAGHDG
jgi:hypothetical protein